MAVGGYDGMRVIYKALKATKGGSGEALLAAMKGQIFESPRGPVLIDAQTRDIVQDIYIRKVERVDGQLYNVEFDVDQGREGPGQVEVSPPRRASRSRRPRRHRTTGLTFERPRMLTTAIRRRRLRHAAVRAGRRAGGDAWA